MQKIFSQEIRFSPKGISSQAQGEADEGSEFCDWEEKKLKHLIREKINNGETILKEEFKINGHIKIVQLNDLFSSNLTLNTQKLERISKNKKIKLLLLNDVIINRVSIKPSGVGKAIVINSISDNELITFESNMFCIRFKHNVNELYFVYYSNTQNYLKQKLALAKVTNQASLSQSDINFINVPLPCIEEQTKIANFLSSIDEKIEQIQKQLEQTKEFKKALL
ncbi:restriction endonuclease subunit S [Arcobacteraceae bacterium]|nr:restriction endonuclease subunit S [Arcobacteraceae bacterium]